MNRSVFLWMTVVLVLAVPRLEAMPPKGAVKVPVAELKKCKGLHPEQCPVIDELTKKGDEASDIVMAMLAHEDPWVKRAAARILVRTADKGAAPALVKAMSNPETEVRSAALEALGLCGSATDGPAVVALLEKETEHPVRVAALRALGRIGFADAAPLLIATLEKEKDAHLLLAAVDSLQLLAAKEALIPLATLVNDPTREEVVRMHALNALIRLKDPRVVPTLLQTSGSPQVELRKRALLGLGILNATALTDYVIDQLADETVLHETVLALGALEDERTVMPLLTVLRAEDLPEDVRRAVLQALGRRKIESAVPELLAMLRRPKSPITADILRALGQIGDERALSRLIEALESDDPVVVGAANSALVEMTGRKMDPNPELWNKWLAERDLPPSATEEP